MYFVMFSVIFQHIFKQKSGMFQMSIAHLFQKVTGINLQEFKKLKNIGLFNEKNMNNAVFAFRRYEEDSLRYTGTTKHHELMIGGWSEKKEHKELKDYLADFFGWKS